MGGTETEAIAALEPYVESLDPWPARYLLAMSRMNLGEWEAAGKIFADDFDPDAAELSDPSVRIVLGWNETVATLVKNDLLDRDLVYDWLWVAGTPSYCLLRILDQRDRESFETLVGADRAGQPGCRPVSGSAWATVCRQARVGRKATATAPARTRSLAVTARSAPGSAARWRC